MRGALALLLTGVAVLPVAAQSSRDSLALALLRFEYVVRDAAPGAISRRGINQAFDRASLGFFMGQGTAAGALLDSVTRALATPDLVARHDATAKRTLAEATASVRWLRRGTDSVPYLVALPQTKAAAPMVIALHGAGGDERMFFTAYGAGALRAEANRRGMIAVTPNSTALAMQPWAFDSLVAVIGRMHPVDSARIYLLGHSMGGSIVARLGRTAGNRIAAVACLAMACGGGSEVVGRVPPMMSRTGALDPIAPPARAEAAAKAAIARGEVVDYATVAEEGHTQLVGPLLPIVLDWLLTQRLR